MVDLLLLSGTGKFFYRDETSRKNVANGNVMVVFSDISNNCTKTKGDI